jgi:hypothetical protein
MIEQSPSNGSQIKAHNPFQFPLRILHGLLSRSEANMARIQNETMLVGSNRL